MLTQDQMETMQEIANIGMGRAGAAIAKVLDQFVVLSIPRVVFLKPEGMAEALGRIVGEGNVSVVRQAFYSRMRGEAIVVFGEQRCNDLADLMGYDEQLDHADEVELLLDVSNIIVGACLGGIAEQLQEDIGFSAPSIMADRLPLSVLIRHETLAWKDALQVEVNFRLEERSFACHLLMLMTESEIKALAESLDSFLANL